jgi:hypothetical protein
VEEEVGGVLGEEEVEEEGERTEIETLQKLENAKSCSSFFWN